MAIAKVTGVPIDNERIHRFFVWTNDVSDYPGVRDGLSVAPRMPGLEVSAYYDASHSTVLLGLCFAGDEHQRWQLMLWAMDEGFGVVDPQQWSRARQGQFTADIRRFRCDEAGGSAMRALLALVSQFETRCGESQARAGVVVDSELGADDTVRTSTPSMMMTAADIDFDEADTLVVGVSTPPSEPTDQIVFEYRVEEAPCAGLSSVEFPPDYVEEMSNAVEPTRRRLARASSVMESEKDDSMQLAFGRYLAADDQPNTPEVLFRDATIRNVAPARSC